MVVDLLEDQKLGDELPPEAFRLYIRLLAMLKRSKSRDGKIELGRSAIRVLSGRSHYKSGVRILRKCEQIGLISVSNGGEMGVKLPPNESEMITIRVPNWPRIQGFTKPSRNQKRGTETETESESESKSKKTPPDSPPDQGALLIEGLDGLMPRRSPPKGPDRIHIEIEWTRMCKALAEYGHNPDPVPSKARSKRIRALLIAHHCGIGAELVHGLAWSWASMGDRDAALKPDTVLRPKWEDEARHGWLAASQAGFSPPFAAKSQGGQNGTAQRSTTPIQDAHDRVAARLRGETGAA